MSQKAYTYYAITARKQIKNGRKRKRGEKQMGLFGDMLDIANNITEIIVEPAKQIVKVVKEEVKNIKKVIVDD